MVLNFDERDNVLLVSLNGELDHHTSEVFKEKFDENVKGKKYNEVILDLKNLSFMDSSGIGALIGRYKLLKSQGVGLSVANLSPQVRKVFSISGLLKVIKDKGELK
ncbi:STAS domain-containing protein [Caldanaerobius polysaccharolyticus]|uniref:STAS domain-containing protein n=1 Tax=Caldanaerobius polysaccharolyticus TaxID=44256 RepID=UPI00047DA7C0|nr:anti-sigma factor antagonist [Caldanaerobius polysaccharolyticus]